ncbi:MAG: hypothetical protein A2138_06375 [Deltaproteobacteria bacterium RBG_16_71_12]|nr:MAG: hypothetical protein A2138_06375 [Deltaproteobacteria bacterium RBG_16_71_12]
MVYATESVGCAIDVEVSGPAEPLAVGVGFTPGAIALDVMLVDGAGGVARFSKAPCGAVWIELDGLPCDGADTDGRLRAIADRDRQPLVVRCQRPFPPPTASGGRAPAP